MIRFLGVTPPKYIQNVTKTIGSINIPIINDAIPSFECLFSSFINRYDITIKLISHTLQTLLENDINRVGYHKTKEKV